MIEIKNLHKSYRRGKEIIPDLNLSLDETGLTMIVGKSGCGKTTLLNIMGSMDMDYEGQVIVDGKDLIKCSYKEIVDYRNFTSAFVFQKNSLFEFLTVEENLKLCMNIQNNTSSISEALEKVGLKGFEHKKVKSLSGGEKQRVAIARALIKNCKIIFADEPTSALDTKNAHKIFQLFKEISKDKLVVLVTHDLKKAVLYADRIVRFVDGVPVEDTRYNQVSPEAKILPVRKTKKLALIPIFKNHLKKGMIINLFISLLLVAAITVTNLALAGIKVKNEYDYFGTDLQSDFNVDRAIATQIKNNIDLYNVVKAEDASYAYSYLENGLPGNTKLNEVDGLVLENELNGYSVHKGTDDSLYNTLIIQGVSTQSTPTRTVNGALKGWRRIDKTNYIYYLYDENNNYDLIQGGRLPNPDVKNEILISDVIAWQYLNNLDPNKLGYELESKDNPESYEYIYNADFIIYDNNGSYDSGKDGVYYIGEPKHYKVVGVIDTGLLDYYTYSQDQHRYLFNSDFKTQDSDRYATFMNSVASQPFGYVVLQEALEGTTANPFLYNTFDIERVKFEIGNVSYNVDKTPIQAFIGTYDYTTNPAEMLDRELSDYDTSGAHAPYELEGKYDDLSQDVFKRLIAKSTAENKLKDNEIIVSVNFAKTLFPELAFGNQIEIEESFGTMADQNVIIRYYDGARMQSLVAKIVGVCNNNQLKGLFYASDELYTKIYKSRYGQSNTLTVDLNGYSISERKELMENLYELGYCLAPVDLMPGSYLEFVEGKGETFAEVDGEGLKSLYPYYSIIEDNGEYYFENDGMIYGVVEVSKNSSGEMTLGTVYMTSTMIKRIALDESYIIKNIGNLSLYYLFSIYYTNESAESGNSILEIMGSMYIFLLGMAILIAIGFIYLKENKEKDTMTKLSMLGVRPRHIYLIHLITYFFLTAFIVIVSLVLTSVFADIINGMFTYSFDSGAIIHRYRLMFEISAVYNTCIIAFGFFVLSLLSSIFVTFKSRK